MFQRTCSKYKAIFKRRLDIIIDLKLANLTDIVEYYESTMVLVVEANIVYTVGYGGRTLQDLIELLRYYNVKRVVDVRRWNKSVRMPEFSGKNLLQELSNHSIEYYWMPELGGYRRFGVDVEDHGVGNCFRSSGFRAYATYLTTSIKVKPHLEKLVELAANAPSSLLCCEKYPWRCHRKILADYLTARGFKVVHVLGFKKIYSHKLHECAEVVEGRLRYR